MSRVGIVTDSTCCLPAELMKEYDVRLVPVGLVINGKVYRDQVEITPEEFWKVFKSLKDLPTTNAASIGDFTETFRALAKSTDGIVCILVSKALSATYESAVQASQAVRSENPGLKIEVVDSKTSAGALGFIVLEAARAAQAGKSLTEVLEVVQGMIPRAKFICAMETLRYLVRTGRAPKTAAFFGELLHVKPLIGMADGTGLVASLGRARGKRNCMEKMIQMARGYMGTDKPVHVMIHYSDRIEDGEELKRLAALEFKPVELYMTPYSPVMSSATGPQIAISFYS